MGRVNSPIPVRQLLPASGGYARGFHKGNPGGLAVVDSDLVADNIKSGATIFGQAGSTNVRDSSDADLAVAEAPTGKTFYAGGGARKTGTGTKTLSPANDTVAAGYYAPTTLSAVDGDLAPANIKQGITIFGKAGTVAPLGTETLTRYYSANVASFANYTPADAGIFFVASDILTAAFRPEYYSTLNASWYRPRLLVGLRGQMALGDGSRLRWYNGSGGTRELCVMRWHVTSNTYERFYDGNIAAGSTYTPGTAGVIAWGAQDNPVIPQINMAVSGWQEWQDCHDTGAFVGAQLTLIMTDGSNLRFSNPSGGALCVVVMRGDAT